MSDLSEDSNIDSLVSILGEQNSSGHRFAIGFPQSRGRAPAQPACPENQDRFVRHTTPSSDQLPRHTTPDDLRQPNTSPVTGVMPSGRARRLSVAPVRSPSPPSQGDLGLVMPRPSSLELPHVEAPSVQPFSSRASGKWDSDDEYVEYLRSLKPRPVDTGFQRPAPTFPRKMAPEKSIDNVDWYPFSESSNYGDALYDSELESEAGDSSPMLRSSAHTSDTSIQSGTLQSASSSAGHEIYSAFDELDRLRQKHHDAEMRYFKTQLDFSNTLCRDEALNEISKALRDRASTKFTMGRSERLILEREANIIFRMTSTGPASAARQRIDTLQTERDETREAVLEASNKLSEKVVGLLQDHSTSAT